MQAHIFVLGFVQGVGFRQFVKRKARELNLSGFVKNLPDGRVEALFQGAKEDLDKIIEYCKKGPFLAEVEEVNVLWEEEKEVFSDFKTIA